MTRYITTWRETGEHVLDWGHHLSETRDETERVVANITARGVHQYYTYPIGEKEASLSSDY